MSASSVSRESESVAAAYLTVQQAAARLQVSHDTIERLAKSHGLPVIRLGKNVRIRTDLLDQWVLDFGSAPGKKRRRHKLAATSSQPSLAPAT